MRVDDFNPPLEDNPEPRESSLFALKTDEPLFSGVLFKIS